VINQIKNVTCVGSGLIGQGWATLFSAAGYHVTMQDIAEDQLKKALKQVSQNLKQLEENGHLQNQTANSAFDLIQTTLSLGKALIDSGFVLESVPDNYPAKKNIFQQLDSMASPDAIFATSSSGLLMSEIQTAATKPERCVVAHPFLPVHLIPLVEVVGGKLTSQETIETTCSLMEKIGKTPVRVKKEVPGYIVNRLQTAVFREAVDLVANGVASAEEVDKAFCSGIGMRDPFIGPLLRAHLTANGIDNFFEHYAEPNRLRLETMATWSEFSTQIKNSLVKSINKMPIVGNKSLDEIKTWRDKMLMKILRLKLKNPIDP
jgi:carnitine 3-dehydrogenase